MSDVRFSANDRTSVVIDQGHDRSLTYGAADRTLTGLHRRAEAIERRLRGEAGPTTARGRADQLTARGRADQLTARGRADPRQAGAEPEVTEAALAVTPEAFAEMAGGPGSAEALLRGLRSLGRRDLDGLKRFLDAHPTLAAALKDAYEAAAQRASGLYSDHGLGIPDAEGWA